MRLLLPEPETPVIQTNNPRGILTSIDLRLLCFAPFTVKYPAPGFLLIAGTAIFLFPERYIPVTDFFSLIISFFVPDATTSPPNSPAPGPRSTMWSAERIVCLSCSTTITVFPIFLRFFNVRRSLLLSL